jgi:hypothetical protein
LPPLLVPPHAPTTMAAAAMAAATRANFMNASSKLPSSGAPCLPKADAAPAPHWWPS